ncbi:hypothetical protein BT63DRAFT_210065 [Microthyrium microscopicum]|uniref:DUF7730 domain-containing protein n=1 Tax=Microthyrium microscopicum TaxID=703497 RepID=A0A6A6UIA4_9PEZI|nr:hypothetical protein BT63DRAFT_210065 [Microthyrium microscopicum]
MSLHTGSTGLFKLPLELRTIVYNFLLIGTQSPHVNLFYCLAADRAPTQNTTMRLFLSSSPLHPKFNAEVSILRTCKQVHEEATPILYQKNTFTVSLQRTYQRHPPMWTPASWIHRDINLLTLASYHAKLFTRIKVFMDEMTGLVPDTIMMLFPALRFIHPISKFSDGHLRLRSREIGAYALHKFSTSPNLKLTCSFGFNWAEHCSGDEGLTADKERWFSQIIEYKKESNGVVWDRLDDGSYQERVVNRWYIPHFGPHRELMKRVKNALKEQGFDQNIPLAWKFRTITSDEKPLFLVIDLEMKKRQNYIPCEIVGAFGEISRVEGLDEEPEMDSHGLTG